MTEASLKQALTEPTLPRVHYTQLWPSDGTKVLDEEWETYRCEVGGLLAAGHEGKYVLIKGTKVFGVWMTRREALTEGHRQFPGGPFSSTG